MCVSIVEKIAGYVNMGNEGKMLASIACSPFDLICLLEKHFTNELVVIPIVYWYDEVGLWWSNVHFIFALLDDAKWV